MQNAVEHGGYTAVQVARTIATCFHTLGTAVEVARAMQRAVHTMGTAVKVARNAATNKGANVTPYISAFHRDAALRDGEKPEPMSIRG